MRGCRKWLAVVAVAALASPVLGQSRDAQDRGSSRQRSASSSSSSTRSGPAITPTPPADQRVPLPGGRASDRVPGRAPEPRTPPPRNPPRGGDDDRGPRDRDDEPDRYRPRYPRRPYYYDYWVYDRGPYYPDRYRGYDAPPPPDRGYDRVGDGDAWAPGAPEAGPGATLPPEDLMGDEDLPDDVRKALDASPEYREATAELLRAWADYVRAADPVLQRLKQTPRYQRALDEWRDAEARAAAVRDRGRDVPAVNLVTAAQQALLARREVRSLEQKAIDADPVASRARDRVDDAVERRNQIREDVKARVEGN